MSGRCSPTDALNLLIPAFEPPAAAAELTRGIHDNTCPVICNGVVIKSHIAPRLLVVAHEADGCWTASIAGTFQVGGVLPTDVWEFETDKVMALRLLAATIDKQRRRPGTKPKYPLWRLEAANFAHGFFKKKTRMPSAREVAEHLQIKCDGWAPDDSDILKLIRFLHSE